MLTGAGGRDCLKTKQRKTFMQKRKQSSKLVYIILGCTRLIFTETEEMEKLYMFK